MINFAGAHMVPCRASELRTEPSTSPTGLPVLAYRDSIRYVAGFPLVPSSVQH